MKLVAGASVSQRNPIGLTFVVHTGAAHLIKGFTGPGHPDELPLCGSDDGAYGATTLAGYLEGGEFDCAGNPMPVCEACKAKAKRAPWPSKVWRYRVVKGIAAGWDVLDVFHGRYDIVASRPTRTAAQERRDQLNLESVLRWARGEQP